jgi:hypothetical protein|tara:strand:+ start:3992 stop:4390 length:399 start_codon:yes stop_codon:yes gene_type:complete
MNKSEDIQKIFEMNTIAVVGMSPKPERPSNYVAMYMKEKGYTIYPVNPGHREIAGLRCFPNLLEIPVDLDVVNVFRRPEHILPIAKATIEICAKALWLQDGVINEAAAQLAEEAGLMVVMNDCMLRQHRKLF